MVIIQLLGGLGNQMFQYAAARRLALEKSTVLKLDVSPFATYTLRTYKLGHFNVEEKFADVADCDSFTSPRLSSKLRRRAERTLLPRPYRRLYREQMMFEFEPAFLKTPNNVYLQGYFQNEKYFKPIEPLIRREFMIKSPPDAANSAMAAYIRSVNAVSLHIRRGDYASNPFTRSIHGLLPLSYYQQAVARIAAGVAQPHFFVFSDDPEWAREHLRLEHPMMIIDHNSAEQDYEDLRLMSLCRHHIIANSSFSWWGAWLCNEPDKQIYAPKKWTNSSATHAEAILPVSWYRL